MNEKLIWNIKEFYRKKYSGPSDDPVYEYTITLFVNPKRSILKDGPKPLDSPGHHLVDKCIIHNKTSMKRHIVKLEGGNTQLEKNKSKNSFPLCLVGMGKIPINLGDCPPEMLFTTATCNLLTFRFFVTFKCNFIEKEPSIAFQKVKQQGFGAGAARSRGIWLEPEPSLWPGSGSGSTLYIC